MIRVAITGIGVEAPLLPGVTRIGQLLDGAPSYGWHFQPADKLGKKGLRYKEPATLLGLCAARAALIDSGWLPEGVGAADTRINNDAFGVAIASNTGNLDTVCAVADTIRAQHVNATSPMDLPNASSNVIASTIAIRFGLRAMNLMLTSGANASGDALVLAYSAIRAGRVAAMLVGAVEVDSLALRSLQAGARLPADVDSSDAEAAGQGSVVPAATTVILESEAAAIARGARIYGYLDDYAFGGADERAQLRFAAFVEGAPQALRCASDTGAVDLTERIGQLYGGLAAAQLVYACEEFAAGRASAAMLVSGVALGDRRATGLSVARA
ncbi:MAG: beta-ketoacyl synthase N-terminal-like domain-containing protein [Gammaproteobacteria bacterium]